jgi:HEAT repeat protein
MSAARKVCLSIALVLAGAACAGKIVDYPEEKPLTTDELKEALTGNDFRLKNAAREQLESLAPAPRLALLKELLANDDSATRLLAVTELAKLPADVHTPLLEPLARDDPDEEVRQFAGMVLEGEE